jgi:pyruvate/2-oxoglutarate dehydrogenase complex dihydrolipoamide acyltransferase (E2) component
MTEIEIVTVKLTQDEVARGSVFWEINPHHALANPALENGEVFIADGEPHIVADTYAVKEAVRRKRLDILLPSEPQPIADEDILATDSARDLAEDHGISLLDLAGSGKNGAIITADVHREIARRQGLKADEE